MSRLVKLLEWTLIVSLAIPLAIALAFDAALCWHLITADHPTTLDGLIRLQAPDAKGTP